MSPFGALKHAADAELGSSERAPMLEGAARDLPRQVGLRRRRGWVAATSALALAAVAMGVSVAVYAVVKGRDRSEHLKADDRAAEGLSDMLFGNLCPEGGVQAGCMEKGDIDTDCCALPWEAGCISGSPPLTGSSCSLAGDALATCCPQVGLPQADDQGLFCWVLAKSNTGEAALVRDHFYRKQHIFACNSWSVFSDGKIDPVDVTNIGKFTAAWGSWGSWLNVADFLRAWDAVFSQGKYVMQGWTVKLDADAVFFPERLRWRLKGLSCRDRWNLRNGGGTLLGPIEVLSAGAVQTLAERRRVKCTWDIKSSGEDGFLKDCLRAVGIQHKADWSLLRSDQKQGACYDKGIVAFHPFKTVGAWDACHDAAAR